MRLALAGSTRRIPLGNLAGILADAPRRTLEVESVTLVFEELPIPSKKNRLTPSGAGRRLRYSDSTAQAMKDLLLVAKVQWGARAKLSHPDLHFWIGCHEGKDRDGIVTTLIDVLVKAGVLEDDCVRHLNGLMIVYPARPLQLGQTSARIRIDFPPETP